MWLVGLEWRNWKRMRSVLVLLAHLLMADLLQT